MKTISLYDVTTTEDDIRDESAVLYVLAIDEADAAEAATRLWPDEMPERASVPALRHRAGVSAEGERRTRGLGRFVCGSVSTETAEDLISGIFGSQYYDRLRRGLEFPDDDLVALRQRIVTTATVEGAVFFTEVLTERVVAISNTVLLAVRRAIFSVAQAVRPEQLLETYSLPIDDGRSYDEELYVRAIECGRSQNPEELARGLAQVVGRCRIESDVNTAYEELNCHPAIAHLAQRLAELTLADDLQSYGAAEEECETEREKDGAHKMYQEALAVQEVTCVLGVIRTMAARLDAVAVNAHSRGQSLGEHAVMRLFASRIRALAFMGDGGEASAECVRRLIVARARNQSHGGRMVAALG